VQFDSMPGRTLSTSWPTTHEPDLALVNPGATVDAEIYGGKVAQLAGQHTVDNPENVPKNLWELSAFFAILGMPLLGISVQMARAAWREQPIGTPRPAFSGLSNRSRYAILAAVFLVIGTPLTVFLLINARSTVELAYRAVTGIVLLAIGLSLAWTAWRQPK
jgi:hypothetical protein